MQILLVEDDPGIIQTLKKGLSENGYDVSHAHNVSEATRVFEYFTHDLVLLDLGLPGQDGLDFLSHLRKQKMDTPVIVLTARDRIDDRITGLKEGADDYIGKPFAFSELLARVEAVLRRAVKKEATVTDGLLQLNRIERQATANGQSLELTQRETDILAYLLANRHRIVSKDELAMQVWKIRSRATPVDNLIEVSISRLRGKLREGLDLPCLETVRGMGYRYQP